ncbi:branched-chain amino acid ABC transporter permease [Natronosalvus halobius]|uniref:branched-chain amino acid ABC transporter permease n=1 Tax=Natronosalvus halobius TaxID=2953746 RepID=UPI00209F6DBD|nr:branched-chain amino acid ABC transporter permease [Natronosalvus halobius]USZ73581.1 branched-chain amino acid ABC transporter permease [Natronosalvus halobius]
MVTGQGLLRLVLLAFIWSGYAAAWNLFSGFSGYISFGHAVFFGLGGFTSTVLLADYGVTPWIGMIAGALVAVAAAIVIGLVTFRAGLSGIYFALSVLAFPLILAPVLVWLGYIELSVPFNNDQPYYYMSFRGLFEYYYIALGMLLFTMAVCWKVQRSRLGFYLQAIKSSEEAAESLGVSAMRYKLYALSLSAFLSAMLGTVYTQVNYIFATQGIFSVHVSAEPVILAVAGGLGTLYGPLVAGLTLFPLAEMLRSSYGSVIPGIHNIIYGIVLIVVIIYFPDGLYASLRQRIIGDADKPEGSTTSSDMKSSTSTERSD